MIQPITLMSAIGGREMYGIHVGQNASHNPEKSGAVAAGAFFTHAACLPALIAAMFCMPFTASAQAQDLCAGLKQAVAEAAQNFATLKTSATPVGSVRNPRFPARILLPGSTKCEISERRRAILYNCERTQAQSSKAAARSAFNRDVAAIKECFPGVKNEETAFGPSWQVKNDVAVTAVLMLFNASSLGMPELAGLESNSSEIEVSKSKMTALAAPQAAAQGLTREQIARVQSTAASLIDERLIQWSVDTSLAANPRFTEDDRRFQTFMVAVLLADAGYIRKAIEVFDRAGWINDANPESRYLMAGFGGTLRAWSRRGGPGVVPEAAGLAARIEALVGSDARASRHFRDKEEEVLKAPLHATPSCEFRGETIRAYEYRPLRDKDVGPDDPDLRIIKYSDGAAALARVTPGAMPRDDAILAAIVGACVAFDTLAHRGNVAAAFVQLSKTMDAISEVSRQTAGAKFVSGQNCERNFSFPGCATYSDLFTALSWGTSGLLRFVTWLSLGMPALAEVPGISSSALASSEPPLGADGKTRVAPRRAQLGVSLQSLTAALADFHTLPTSQGALVVAVNRGGPADKAGIVSGDVILAFNDRIIGDAADLSREVARTMPGMTVALTVWRNKARRSIRASLGEAP